MGITVGACVHCLNASVASRVLPLGRVLRFGNSSQRPAGGDRDLCGLEGSEETQADDPVWLLRAGRVQVWRRRLLRSAPTHRCGGQGLQLVDSDYESNTGADSAGGGSAPAGDGDSSEGGGWRAQVIVVALRPVWGTTGAGAMAATTGAGREDERHEEKKWCGTVGWRSGLSLRRRQDAEGTGSRGSRRRQRQQHQRRKKRQHWQRHWEAERGQVGIGSA